MAKPLATLLKKVSPAVRAKAKTKAGSIMDTVQTTARGLHKAGVLDDLTMRDFDALCLPPVKVYSPAQIRRIRLKNRASQAVFAAFLNTSSSTVQKWEQGQKKPNGPSLKLLNLVEKNGLQLLAS